MLHDQSLPPLSGGEAKSAVIILHGLGDSGAGILPLGEAWRQGLPDTVFLAPDAPFPCDMAPFGFQWFSSQDWSQQVVLAGIQNAVPSLNDYIDHVIASYKLTPAKVALVGFSQGTMMSLYVAPRRTPSLAGIVGYSGALFGAESLPNERRSAPPVLLIHGMLDDVVPFAAMAHAQSGLQNANINVQTLACPGLYHSVDDAGLAEGLHFLRKALL